MPTLKFVNCTESGSERDIALCRKAVASAKEHDIPVEKINDTQAILDCTVNEGDADIYVCSPFSGDVFEALKKNKYRVIGPQCVISCLLLEVSVPKRLYPVSNVAMLGVVACCSSMKKDDRRVTHALIQSMGGDVTTDFTNSVTHLIAQEVGSKKYQVACQSKVPCLLPAWVQKSWQVAQYEHLQAGKESYMQTFLTPPLQGCTICVSGFALNERNRIRELIKKNGGTYSGELNMKTCTHLLVEEPKGQKYTFARQWKLHCVKPQWLYDCLSASHWLAESTYKVGPDENHSNNKTANNTNDNSKIVNIVDDSMLPPANISRVEALSIRSLSNSKLQKSLSSEKLADENEIKLKPFDAKSIDISQVKPCEDFYFDGFKIYMCNLTGPLFDVCRKIINNAGGFRLNTLSDAITHVVVCGSATQEVMKYLKDCQDQLPFIVSPLWLLECTKQNKALPEKDFSLLVSSTMRKSSSDLEAVFQKPGAPLAEARKQAVSTSLHLDTFADDKDNTLLNQYLPSNHESTRLSQVGEEPPPPVNNTLKNDSTITNNDTSTAILQQRKFHIARYDSEQSDRIKELIEEYSGVIVDSMNAADYIIVPLTYTVPMKIHPREVTVCWLEQSVDTEELLDVRSNYLFRPILYAEKAKPLQGCVVTISQYAGMERQHLFHLAELLGADAQEFFARRDNKDIKASTHLILSKPEGSKYGASQKWKIPCMCKEWLFACAKYGKRMPEDDYNLFSQVESFVPKDDEAEETITDQQVQDEKPFDTITDQQVDDEKPCEEDHCDTIVEQRPVSQITKTTDVEIENPFSKTIDTTVAGKTSPPRFDIDFSNFNRTLEGESKRLTEERISSSSPAVYNVKEMNKSSRLSFDFTDALDTVQSPAVLSQDSRRKSRKSRGSLPFNVQFAEAIERAIDKHVPEGDRINADQLENAEEDVFNKTLNGVIIMVGKSLSQRKTELHTIAKDLGATCQFTYTKECTHFVHQGGEATAKDASQAKRDNKHLVSPHWLEACAEDNTRVAEALYPCSYNPRKNLQVSPTVKSAEKASPGEKEILENNEENDKVVEKIPDFQSKMQQIMDAAKQAPVKERRSRRSTAVRESTSRNSRPVSSNESSSGKQDKEEQFQMTEQSQVDCITYDDPTGRLERQRILAQLKEACPSQDTESFHQNLEKRILQDDLLKKVSEPAAVVNEPPANIISFDTSADPLSTTTTTKKALKFMLSGMSAQEKINYAAVIEHLGGEVFDYQYFTPACTHVVVSVPNRNEKFLGSIACGKWVMHKSFLEASREAGAFVEESGHEWGSQQNTGAFAASAKRWRIQLGDGVTTGAFDGWVVVLCIEASKMAGFKRILEAGGGKVVHERPPFEKLAGVTHAFVGDKSLASTIDYTGLQETDVMVLKPEYISDYLTVFPPPLPTNYVIVKEEAPRTSKRRATDTGSQRPKRSRR